MRRGEGRIRAPRSAVGLSAGDDRRPVLLALAAGRDALDAAVGSTAAPSPASEAFRFLVDEADRTYLDLVALRNVRRRLEPSDGTVAARAFEIGREAAAEALTAVADALESGRWRANLDTVRDRLDASVAVLRAELADYRAAAETFAPTSSRMFWTGALRSVRSCAARSTWPRPGRAKDRPQRIPSAIGGGGAQSLPCAVSDRSFAPT